MDYKHTGSLHKIKITRRTTGARGCKMVKVVQFFAGYETFLKQHFRSTDKTLMKHWWESDVTMVNTVETQVKHW